jgi:BON domain
MTEPLFGTAPPIWSAVPFPGPAWFQTPVAGGRPIAEGIVNPQGFAAGLQGIISGPQGQGTLGNGMVSGIPMLGPSFSPAPPVGRQDMAGGVTATALVLAVALRRGQPAGPASDQEIEDFLYDALDLLPGSSDVEVRCDGGRTTLTGTVSQKGLKRDIGEIAWAIPGIKDVQNNITIAPRRRARAQNRDSEAASVAGRKPA